MWDVWALEGFPDSYTFRSEELASFVEPGEFVAIAPSADGQLVGRILELRDVAKRCNGSRRTLPCQWLAGERFPVIDGQEGRGAAQAANRPGKAKQAPAETLVQQPEAETALVSPANRKMPKRDLDTMVDQMIGDNFLKRSAGGRCLGRWVG